MQTQVLKTKKEKADYMENDLIERLVRIEQRVSAKFGKLIKYKDTYCYKNLIPENKERYEKYLNLKKKKKVAFMTSLVLPLFGVLMLSNSITGNVVKEGVGSEGFSVLYLVLISIFAVILLGSGIFFLSRLRRKKRFDPLFEPLEKISKKKKSL